jgi:inorganic pyrophosphatase
MRWAIFVLLGFTAQLVGAPLQLSHEAVQKLQSSISAAAGHDRSIWRDVPPTDEGGRVTALVEIARGDHRKFEFDIRANAMRLDRMIPAALGGYPINYGIVPQTISYDGDPFDVLVLGPALASGTLVQGVIVGVLRFEDERGADSKVVVSPVDADGRPRFSLSDAERSRMTAFFNAYKRHEPGKFSRVIGWGSADEGLALVRVTHRFYLECRSADTACRIAAR